MAKPTLGSDGGRDTVRISHDQIELAAHLLGLEAEELRRLLSSNSGGKPTKTVEITARPQVPVEDIMKGYVESKINGADSLATTGTIHTPWRSLRNVPANDLGNSSAAPRAPGQQNPLPHFDNLENFFNFSIPELRHRDKAPTRVEVELSSILLAAEGDRKPQPGVIAPSSRSKRIDDAEFATVDQIIPVGNSNCDGNVICTMPHGSDRMSPKSPMALFGSGSTSTYSRSVATQFPKSARDLRPRIPPFSVPGENLDQVIRSIGPSKLWIPPPRTPRGRKPKVSASNKGKNRDKSKRIARPVRRGPLTAEVRESAKLLRRIGVCVICQHKKARCSMIDPTAPDEPCRRCKWLEMPCLRYKVTDASLYREQEAPFHLFSQRWKTMDMVDITDWADDEVRIIRISLDFLHAPYAVKVRKFIPHPGDMLEERWHDGLTTRTFAIPPYGIINMAEAADSVGEMIEREVGNFICRFVGELDVDKLIWETYLAAFKHASQARTLREQTLITNTLRLWVMCRMSSHRDIIIGEDRLGMSKVDDPTSPYLGSVPTPPIFGAQLECIYYSRFLRPLSKRVLRGLLALIETKGRQYWLTIYFVLFIMLHSCSMMTRRDAEYAAQISLPTKYANPESIKKHQSGAITLLAHFHLGLKGSLPFKLALEGKLNKYAETSGLTIEAITFITRSALFARAAKEGWEEVRANEDLGNDFYWISQLYDENWKPEKMN